MLVRGHAHAENLEKYAIWCILKCILIKIQGKNSLKISVFIATTTKKGTRLLGESYGVGTGHMLTRKVLKKCYTLF